MAIDRLHDFSALSVSELYAVYQAVAHADHRWRIFSFYGDATPPEGHRQFRPLSLEHFQQRHAAAQMVSEGETAFRQQLARQARAYRVDVRAALDRCRAAA